MERECQICSSNRSSIIYEEKFREIVGVNRSNYMHTIRICEKCGFVFVSPTIAENELSDYYAYMSLYDMSIYQFTDHNSLSQRINRYQRIFTFINDYIKKSLPELSHVLDIGCSTGYLLSLFKTNGYKVMGIDPSSKCKEIALQEYGINVRTGTLDTIQIQNEKYDIIILSHVLEHIVDLSYFILKLKSILSPKGIIYIEVPDVQNINLPFGYFSFEHVNYFSKSSLKNLMAKNGLNPEAFGKSCNKNEGENFPFAIYGIFKDNAESKLLINNDYKLTMESIEKYRIIESDNKFSEKFDSIFMDYDNIAIFGGGTHTSRILSMLKDEYFAKISAIFDNDPKKNNTSINGINVYSPFTKEKIYEKMIDVIIISSLAYENEIYEQIKHLENDGIRIIKLYS